MTLYITLDEALRIHALLIKEFGGALGVRDLGLIQSALLRPQTGYYADLIEEAAALWESLTMNHGFLDGNKRVGFATTHVFLRVNGLDISASADATYDFVISSLESGQFEKNRLEHWLRGNTKPRAVASG